MHIEEQSVNVMVGARPNIPFHRFLELTSIMTGAFESLCGVKL